MTNEKEITLTLEGKEQLEKEYRNLIDVERPKVIADLQSARAMGDLSENADYDAARNKQAEVEGRIKEIEYILHNAKIVKEDKNSKKVKDVKISSLVKYLNLSTNKEITVSIVSSIESDPFVEPKKISNVCALGEALIGHKVGDEVEVKADRPYQVKILEIK